jgi:hypothetical protein
LLSLLFARQKFDKSLKKVDRYYAEGDFKKASASLVSLRKSIVAKLGQKNTYVLDFSFVRLELIWEQAY